MNHDSAIERELRRIDAALQEPALLIGGLAVKHFVPQRSTQDIDLVLDQETAKGLINTLYESRYWSTVESNGEDYRPHFIVTPKPPHPGPAIHLGFKIKQRAPYQGVNYASLAEHSIPLRIGPDQLSRITVPIAERLCAIKLVAFLSRRHSAVMKARQDLRDSLDLCNSTAFRYNLLLDYLADQGLESRWQTELRSAILETSYGRERYDASSPSRLANVFPDIVATKRRLVIGMSGASKTGKSTLIAEVQRGLQDEGESVLVRGSPAADTVRELQEKSGRDLRNNPRDTRPEDYPQFFAKLLDKVLSTRQGQQEDVCLLDRTYFDTLAYLVTNNNAPLGWMGFSLGVAELYAAHLDCLFYLPIDPAYSPEYATPTNYYQYQQEIDKALGALVAKHGSNRTLVVALTGKLNERAEKVVEIIKGLRYGAR